MTELNQGIYSTVQRNLLGITRFKALESGNFH